MKKFLFIFILLTICALASCSFGDEVKEDEKIQTSSTEMNTDDYGGTFPTHEPYGTGVGLNPGRVVWAYDKDAVNWNGEGYWWESKNFDENVISTMLNDSLSALSGEETPVSSWEALFKAHNESLGKDGTYSEGEKIAIKVNLNGSGVNDDDYSGETNLSYTNAVLLKTLLKSLVGELKVKPEDITVYDVSRIVPKYMKTMCSEGELNGVSFVGRKEAVADKNAPINWSYDFEGPVNYLPTCVTEAQYLINLANLKGHSYGMTLTAKNNFGSFLNDSALRPPQEANLHQFLIKSEMGIYSPLVDLTANAKLGKKTVLYLLDGLICAPSEGIEITKENATWKQDPFNESFTASLLISQDPVAIDSVGADLLTNEPTVLENNPVLKDTTIENYLHEEALVSDSPSGTAYTDGEGNPVKNLGVHEHWNKDKEYSKNLGKDIGIELIKVFS